ncbi:MAG: NAD-dependent succinate-semialdehyde dehydrogenase [Chlamydiota bacterium]|nr:NAD-dependent succinate-semialdehyde dehydrogenase [Chlamydiota bacterium]
MVIESRNPATEEVLAEFNELTIPEIEHRVGLAQKAFESWEKMTYAERKALFLALAQIFKEKSIDLARIMALEMGKPVSAGTSELEKCAMVCKFYAENTSRFLAHEVIPTDAARSFARFDPLGIILAVMPWNFPVWQVMRFAAPALMAGNVGILKHASNVPQCALAIESFFREAGFPENVFQSFLIGSGKVDILIRDPRVKAVTLTGSELAGSKVASLAGSLLKKTVLELGGSDPFIVLKDADLQSCCSVGAAARLQNAGQSCIAAKRFIVEEPVLEEFVMRSKKQYESITVGDPLLESTQMGPLATESILNELQKQVEASVQMGALVVTGGKRMPGKGYYYEPTILTQVCKGMPVFDEEVFGPVAAVISVKDSEEALAVANDTSFGLGASVWTQDLRKAEIFAARIQSGAVFINGMVKSDPRLPFGGIGRSGYGRELSHYGIKEFVNIKTVWMK